MKHLSFILAMSLAFTSSAQTDCGYQPDIDPDFAIGVSDVLGILGLFGEVDTDQDYLWDSEDLCTDLEACNYNANPTEECLYLDAFGVCGGDGILPELLLGSWRLSTAAGAVSVGPNPYSSEWFSSPLNGLQAPQYDDVYTFNADGTLTTNYNGSIIDAFLDYSEQGYGCTTATLDFTPGAGTSGEDSFTLSGTGGACGCPFIGTNDGGLVFDIVELTATTLRLHTYSDNTSCQQTGGYFSYILTRINDNTGGTDGDGYQGADGYPGMNLVWSDEFDGTTINSSNWTYDLGASGWGNNEWQNYTSLAQQQLGGRWLFDDHGTPRGRGIHLRALEVSGLAGVPVWSD